MKGIHGEKENTGRMEKIKSESQKKKSKQFSKTECPGAEVGQFDW